MKKFFAFLLTATMLLSMLAMFASAEGEPAPIAVFNFEDTANLGKDVSGNKNHLEDKGGVDSVAEGKYGKGVAFDYANALVATTDADGADFIDKIEMSGTKQMTLMFWIKHDLSDYAGWDTTIGWRRVVSNGNDGGAGYGGFAMLDLNDNYIVGGDINPACVFYTEKEGTQSKGNWSKYGWTTEWTHIAWTVDATTGRCMFYVNGNPIFDLTTPNYVGDNAMVNLNRNFAIGANYLVDGEGNEIFNHSFAGKLDDFYVFDAALNAEQIAVYASEGEETTPAPESTSVPETTPAPETSQTETTEPPAVTEDDTDAATTTENGAAEDGTETTSSDSKAPATQEPDAAPVGVIVGIVVAVVVVAILVTIILLKKGKNR